MESMPDGYDDWRTRSPHENDSHIRGCPLNDDDEEYCVGCGRILILCECEDPPISACRCSEIKADCRAAAAEAAMESLRERRSEEGC